MAMINMKIRELKTLSENVESLDDELFKVQSPELEDILNSIKQNVQNTYNIDAVIDRINSQITTINGELRFDLSKLERFIDTQIETYNYTEEEALAELNHVLAAMNTFAATGSMLVPGSPAHSVLAAAEKISDTMIKEQHSYSLTNLDWNNIEATMDNDQTCCASYVGAVLYESGLVSESEMNSFNYNSSAAMYSHFKNKWEKVSSINNLEAGDIVFMTSSSSGGGIGHVQIYAGNGEWYNAGSTSAIRRGKYADSSQNYRFISALRPDKSS